MADCQGDVLKVSFDARFETPVKITKKNINRAHFVTVRKKLFSLKAGRIIFIAKPENIPVKTGKIIHENILRSIWATFISLKVLSPEFKIALT